jgi:hypothetical protein
MHCLDGWVYLCRSFVWLRKTFSPVVDEITHRPFVWGYRQIRFVHVCTVHAQNLTWSICGGAWPCTILCIYPPDRFDTRLDGPADSQALYT